MAKKETEVAQGAGVMDSAESKELSVRTPADIMIGLDTDVSGMSLEERANLLERWTVAQANDQIDDSKLGKELTVTGMTVYQKEFIDQETGAIGLASYVAFEFADGTGIRTASSQAVPFALATARLIGYNPVNGKLPHPIKIMIVPQKATTGFIYRFVFKGLAK